MGGDIEHWKRCLVNSIQLFCRNFCQYSCEAKIEGLLAITLDKKEVILIKLAETDVNGVQSEGVSASSQPSSEQSEQLESILRYLAPSCRLLKKAAVKQTSLTKAPLWQPVSDGTTDSLDRYSFLRSLGLVPSTHAPADHSDNSSCISRLQIAKMPSVDCQSMSDLDWNKANNYLENVKVASSFYKKEAFSSSCSSGKQSTKHQKSATKTDANANEKLPANKCNQQCDKMPLVDSSAVNCNHNVRICLDSKNVCAIMNGKKSVKVRSANSSNVKKPVKLLKKRKRQHQNSNATEYGSDLKMSTDSSAKRLKINSQQRSENIATVSSKMSSRQKFKKSIIKDSEPTLEESNSENALVKTGVKRSRKTSANSQSLAGDLKSKIASRKLLNKTKASRCKVLYGKQANTKKESHLKSLVIRRTPACGKCAGCRVKENCGTCIYCRDMRSYGGENRLHKKCCLRQCRMLKKNLKKSDSKLNDSCSSTETLQSCSSE